MNTKILSVLLLLVVAIGFSGLGSAAVIQRLVTPAYDEQVLVTPAYNITVVDQDAYNKTVVDEAAYNKTVVDQEAYNVIVVDEAAYWLWHCNIHKWVEAVFTQVEHPAVYETVTVTDVEAYDETIVDQAAYDELISAEIPAYDDVIVDQPAQPAHDELVQQKWFNNWNGAEGWANAQVRSGHADSYEIYWAWHGCHYDVLVNTYEHHNAVPAVTHVEHHDAVPAVYQHHDAITHVVHHDAVTHEEQRLVSAAWIEDVLVTPAHDEVTNMDVKTGVEGYSDMIAQCSAAVPGWNWIYHPHDEFAAVTHEETIPAVTHEEFVPAVTHEETVPAVTHEETVDAVYKIVHHDAVYESVIVSDPAKPVNKVAPENTIPMQHTGGDFTGILVALLAILAGLGIYFGFERRE